MVSLSAIRSFDFGLILYCGNAVVSSTGFRFVCSPFIFWIGDECAVVPSTDSPSVHSGVFEGDYSSAVVSSTGIDVVACPALITCFRNKPSDRTKHNHARFSDVIDVVEIPCVPEANKRPITEHNHAYCHSEELRALDPAVEQKIAHLRAVSWRQQLVVEYGLSLCNKHAVCQIAVPAELERGVRRWLVDTGCPIDLIAERDLEKHELEYVKHTSKPVMLSTANGSTKSEKIISMDVSLLKDNVEAYVLNATPTVLSVGKRCMDLGYHFVWRAFKRPFLISPKGHKIMLDVIDNVPYLPMCGCTPSACAPYEFVNHVAMPSPAAINPDASSEDVLETQTRDLKLEACSIRHMMTHLPKNPHCSICQRSKMENVRSQKHGGSDSHGYSEFGEHVTADTLVLHGMKDRGIGNKQDAIVMYDFGTRWLDCVPVNSKSEDDTLYAYREFAGSNCKIKEFYSDGAPELLSAARKMEWVHSTSTPGMPRTNAIAESKVKLVLHGTRCLLYQAGLPFKFWPYACKCFCVNVNVEIKGGDSAFNRRHKVGHFGGKLIPFGALIDFFPTPRAYVNKSGKGNRAAVSSADVPTSDNDVVVDEGSDVEDTGAQLSEEDVIIKDDEPDLLRPKFSTKSVPGLFLGYHMLPGGLWKGDYYVALLSDLRRGKSVPRIQRVKSIYHDETEGWIFPMKQLHDFVSRSAIPYADLASPKLRALQEAKNDMLDPSIDVVDKTLASGVDHETASADFWEYDASLHAWIFHHCSSRKRLFHPLKGGSGGPNPDNLDPLRETRGKYADDSVLVHNSDWTEKGSQRGLAKYWVGFTRFYEKGYAPVSSGDTRSVSSSDPKSTVVPSSALIHADDKEVSRPVSEPAVSSKAHVPAKRKERRYKGSSKPDWIDTHSWVSMSKKVRKHMIELTNRDKERQDSQSSDSAAVSSVGNSDSNPIMSGSESTSDAAVLSAGRNAAPALTLDKVVEVVLLSKTALAPIQESSDDLVHRLFSNMDEVISPGGFADIPTGVSFILPSTLRAHVIPANIPDARVRFEIRPMLISSGSSREIYVRVFNATSSEMKVNLHDCIAHVEFHRCGTIQCALKVCKFAASCIFQDSGNDNKITEDLALPRMPLRSFSFPHRSGNNPMLTFSACVARSVTRKEARSNAKAMASLDKEWDKLRRQGCWDESSVCEWSVIASQARASNKKVHVGRVFDICVEKNSELPETDPNRKFKGRVVFEGCNVRDEENNWAIFSEIASCPATMEASKAADAYGMFAGHDVQIADGESAYTQAKLGGDVTYVRLPPDRWPDSWKGKFRDPVVRLVLALYGHPDAGGFWELHCERALKKVGFVTVQDWKSVFLHPKLDLLLIVYVDDFKLAGPVANLAKGWSMISSEIKMEPPQPVGRYLGCQHVLGSVSVPRGFNPRLSWRLTHPAKKDPPDMRVANTPGSGPVHIRITKYDMASFLEQCVQRYVDLAGHRIMGKIKKVATPFLDESKPEFDENPIAAVSSAGSKSSAAVSSAEMTGVLGDIASAVLMKILYAARMGRYDLIRPVTALGSLITKWSPLCDLKLHRLICYIHSTLDVFMYSWIGDAPADMELVLFCDADLAGDRTDCKSTSGVFMALVGEHSFVPLAGISKKQTSVSKSTPEAEIVAIDHGICKEGLPGIMLWEAILKKPIQIRLMEDNSAACRVVITGRNPSMRHMSRTQRIDVAWLNERFRDGSFCFVECPTEYQAGDIFTKHCTDSIIWSRNLMLIAHFTRAQLMKSGSINVCSAPVSAVSPAPSDQGGTLCAPASDQGGRYSASIIIIADEDPRKQATSDPDIKYCLQTTAMLDCYKSLKVFLPFLACDHVILLVVLNDSCNKSVLARFLKFCLQLVKLVRNKKGVVIFQTNAISKDVWSRGDLKLISDCANLRIWHDETISDSLHVRTNLEQDDNRVPNLCTNFNQFQNSYMNKIVSDALNRLQ